MEYKIDKLLLETCQMKCYKQGYDIPKEFEFKIETIGF